MDLLNDRRTQLVLGGGAVALAAGLAIAWVLLAGHRNERMPPPPASQGGLIIDSSGPEDAKMDPAAPLRCFVAGQPVGEMTLAQCAKRNGVATDALDVGLDETGALAATDQAGAVLTPLPPQETAPAVEQAEPAPLPSVTAGAAPPVAGQPAACWRYAEAKWTRLPTDLPLSACVQTLFAGRCEKPGNATYGRWGQQTLRLAPGKVEISADNHSFHTLAEQGPGCVIPPVG
jgi:hypothetical protein